jgi:hypothetical protein
MNPTPIAAFAALALTACAPNSVSSFSNATVQFAIGLVEGDPTKCDVFVGVWAGDYTLPNETKIKLNGEAVAVNPKVAPSKVNLIGPGRPSFLKTTIDSSVPDLDVEFFDDTGSIRATTMNPCSLARMEPVGPVPPVFVAGEALRLRAVDPRTVWISTGKVPPVMKIMNGEEQVAQATGTINGTELEFSTPAVPNGSLEGKQVVITAEVAPMVFTRCEGVAECKPVEGYVDYDPAKPMDPGPLKPIPIVAEARF